MIERRTLAAWSRLIGSCAFFLFCWLLFYPGLDHLSGSRLSGWLREIGLQRQSAPGFVVTAASVPAGGTFIVDGEPRGALPMLSNIQCTDGQSVELRVEKPGFKPWSRTVSCREGGSLRVRASLFPLD